MSLISKQKLNTVLILILISCCSFVHLHAVVPRVLSAPSPQILREWPNRGAAETVGVVECQVSAGTQFIEWWKESTQLLATLNLTYDDSSAIADELDSNSTSQQGM